MSLLFPAGYQFFDENDPPSPIGAGKLYVYQNGTTNAEPVWLDPALTLPAPSPTVLNAGGRMPNNLYVADGVSVTIDLDTSADADVWSRDDNWGIVGDISGTLITPTGGTTARSIAAILGDRISVKEFGAVGYGVADDTVAIQAAIDSLSSAGGNLYFPTGSYLVTATLTVTFENLYMFGDGRSSTLTRSTDYGDTLHIADPAALQVIDGFRMEGLRFRSTGLTTSGAHVHMDAIRRFFIQDITVLEGFKTFQMDGCTGGTVHNIYVLYTDLFTGSSTGRRQLTLGSSANAERVSHPHGGDVFFSNVNLRGAGPPTPFVHEACVSIASADGYWFSNCHFGNPTGWDLVIDANLPENCNALQFSNCLFDRSDGDLIQIGGSTPTVVGGFYFNNCLMAGGNISVNGIDLNNTDATDVVFSDCTIKENSEHGVNIRSTFTGEVTFENCKVIDNSIGNSLVFSEYHIADTVDNVHIKGGEARGNNSLASITIQGVVHDNVEINDVTVLPNNSGMDLLEGTNISQRNNRGFNPQGDTPTALGTLTPGASPYTYTNVLGFDVEIYVSGGTVSAIAKDGLTLTGVTAGSFVLGPGDTLETTYSVVPNMFAFGL